MPSIHIIRPGLVAGALLLVPFVAMQFTSEVNWTLSDFILMGVMICVTGVLIEYAVLTTGKYKVIAALAILCAFLWLWAELAVGVFTTWGS